MSEYDANRYMAASKGNNRQRNAPKVAGWSLKVTTVARWAFFAVATAALYSYFN